MLDYLNVVTMVTNALTLTSSPNFVFGFNNQLEIHVHFPNKSSLQRQLFLLQAVRDPDQFSVLPKHLLKCSRYLVSTHAWKVAKLS